MSPTKQIRFSLAECIIPLIKEIERQEGFHLTMEDMDFLTNSSINFIQVSATKFINGAKRHFDENNPNFTDGSFNYSEELGKELIDAWFYLEAQKHKEMQLLKKGKL